MPAPRYAIYYTPPPDSPLARFGASILGYDCFAQRDVPHTAAGGLDPAILALITIEPRRYGFHATLTAPFALDGRESELIAAIGKFAARHPPIPLGPLAVAPMGGFLVLSPTQPHARVDEFAARCLGAFDEFRAPPTEADRARRLSSGLTPRQTELFERWGYPYVLNEFRFHMTLAGPVPASQRAALATQLAHAFDGLAANHVEIDAISLMRQHDRMGRFHVLSRCRLTGR